MISEPLQILYNIVLKIHTCIVFYYKQLSEIIYALKFIYIIHMRILFTNKDSYNNVVNS